MSNRVRLLWVVLVTSAVFTVMPWYRTFQFDGAPDEARTKYAGYAFFWDAPAPEVPNHPAYAVEPAFDRILLEWLAGMSVLILADLAVSWKKRKL